MIGRPQLLATAVGIILVAVIYQLPRVVVENEVDAEVASHDFTISPIDAEAMSALTEALSIPGKEKSNIFADSLAGYYLKYGLLDSAQVVAKDMLARDSSLISRKIAISILYSVFERSLNSEEARENASLLRPLIESALDEDSQNLELKNKLAMTLVTTENPMSGINLLREVVAEDSLNREALINLGLLSIRSGQFERAVARFDVLIGQDNLDYEAKLYKGVALKEMGDETANELFSEIAKAESVDPAIRQSAIEYLERD